jgi:hypothetical protein
LPQLEGFISYNLFVVYFTTAVNISEGTRSVVERLVKDELEKGDRCIPKAISPKFFDGYELNRETPQTTRSCDLDSNWVLSE